MSFSLTVENSPKDGVPCFAITGEYDVYTAPQVKAAALKALEEGQTTVILELSGVVYIDSTALGVCIGFLKRCQERGGNVPIVCPTPKTRRAFEITGLDKIFDIFNSVEEAVEHQKKKSPAPTTA